MLTGRQSRTDTAVRYSRHFLVFDSATYITYCVDVDIVRCTLQCIQFISFTSLLCNISGAWECSGRYIPLHYTTVRDVVHGDCIRHDARLSRTKSTSGDVIQWMWLVSWWSVRSRIALGPIKESQAIYVIMLELYRRTAWPVYELQGHWLMTDAASTDRGVYPPKPDDANPLIFIPHSPSLPFLSFRSLSLPITVSIPLLNIPGVWAVL